MSVPFSGLRPPAALPAADAPDPDLDRVAAWWRAQRESPLRIGDVLRRSFDEVLDGQRTGRFRYEDLRNSEKTYTGTKVEILLADEFDLVRPQHGGGQLDYVIDGIDVDCKFSQDTSWMIPMEAVGKLCILVRGSDVTARFSFGLLRCNMEYLNAPNRDRKRGVSLAGRLAATWLWHHEAMPVNLLRNLPPATIDAIIAQPGSSGQTRVNELFRRVQDVIVRREVTLTVAQQADSMTRARDARVHLRPEGILVLGHQDDHPRIAAALGLAVPRKGQLIATRVVPATPQHLADGRAAVVMGGHRWVKALPGDPTIAGPTAY